MRAKHGTARPNALFARPDVVGLSVAVLSHGYEEGEEHVLKVVCCPEPLMCPKCRAFSSSVTPTRTEDCSFRCSAHLLLARNELGAVSKRIGCSRQNEVRWGSAGIEGRVNGKSPRKPSRPAASSGMIPTCENAGVARPGIEPGWIERAVEWSRVWPPRPSDHGRHLERRSGPSRRRTSDLSRARDMTAQLHLPCDGRQRRQRLSSWRPPSRCPRGRAVSLLAAHQGDRVQSPAGSLLDFRMQESCRTMPLVSGFFSRGSTISPALSFRRCSILISITLIGSQHLVKNRPNLFTHSLTRDARPTSVWCLCMLTDSDKPIPNTQRSDNSIRADPAMRARATIQRKLDEVGAGVDVYRLTSPGEGGGWVVDIPRAGPHAACRPTAPVSGVLTTLPLHNLGVANQCLVDRGGREASRRDSAHSHGATTFSNERRPLFVNTRNLPGRGFVVAVPSRLHFTSHPRRSTWATRDGLFTEVATNNHTTFKSSLAPPILQSVIRNVPAFTYHFDSPSTRLSLGWGWRHMARSVRRVMPSSVSMERWSLAHHALCDLNIDLANVDFHQDGDTAHTACLSIHSMACPLARSVSLLLCPVGIPQKPRFSNRPPDLNTFEQRVSEEISAIPAATLLQVMENVLHESANV
ncbi:hypothetical protein PR048_019850 [Dryococelus australis]|uniref:Uncharacterized protein n=1 Tax=Dryococelus australis TaxID=614101 RepID=A0ABQ9H4K9_9NEOP|nr:hypothetical protein PR048_019850 [Dryococelus australis]